MAWLARRSFRQLIDTRKVEEALRAAEATSSGELRVSVAPLFWGDVRRAAERTFDRLGMSATRERNGVLFFVVPARRRLVLLGDAGVHARVGQAFWDSVTAAVTERFAAGDFTGGLVLGIRRVGAELARHFPSKGAADVNELPDQVDFGGHPAPPP